MYDDRPACASDRATTWPHHAGRERRNLYLNRGPMVACVVYAVGLSWRPFSHESSSLSDHVRCPRSSASQRHEGLSVAPLRHCQVPVLLGATYVMYLCKALRWAPCSCGACGRPSGAAAVRHGFETGGCRWPAARQYVRPPAGSGWFHSTTFLATQVSTEGSLLHARRLCKRL